MLSILSTKEIKHEKSDNLLIINPYESSSKPRLAIISVNNKRSRPPLFNIQISRYMLREFHVCSNS